MINLEEQLKENMEKAEAMMNANGSMITIFEICLSHKSFDKKKVFGIALDSGAVFENRFQVIEKIGTVVGLLENTKLVDEMDYISMMSESWFSFDKNGKTNPKIMPSKDPNRREGLNVCISDGKRTLQTGKEIISLGAGVNGKRHFVLKNIEEMSEAKEVEAPIFQGFLNERNRIKKAGTVFPDRIVEGKKVEEIVELSLMSIIKSLPKVDGGEFRFDKIN